MCCGCSVLTFSVRHMRMLSLSTTLASSHPSLCWFSLSSCVLAEICISSCFVLTEAFFFLTYSPPLSRCPLCSKKKKKRKKKKGGRERITSFFSLPFCSTVGPFPHLRGDPLPSHAWTVALCLKMCQKLSSLGHGVFHLCHLYLLGKVPRTFMVLQLLWW